MKKGIFLLACLIGMVSCTDHKDIYNPNPDPESGKNPLELVAPEDFDWLTMKTVKVVVKVNDEFEGKFNYGIEIFGTNPYTDSNAVLLAKGVAKENTSFVVSLDVAKACEELYVRVITPDNLKELRSFRVDGNDVVCDFTGIAAERSRAATPASNPVAGSPFPLNANDYLVPDNNCFPTSSPATISCPAMNAENNGVYLLDGINATINLAGANVKLYVSGEVTISSIARSSGTTCNIYVLPEACLTISSNLDNAGGGVLISVAEGAILNFNNQYQLGNSKLYNRGTVKVPNLEVQGTSYLYNNGKLEVSQDIYTTNGTAKILNDSKGIISSSNTNGMFYLQGGGNAINRGQIGTEDSKMLIKVDSYNALQNEGNIFATDFEKDGNASVWNLGEIKVSGKSTVTSTGGFWINEGLWETADFKASGQNHSNYNKCKLIVSRNFDITDNTLYIEGGEKSGGYVQCKSLTMNNTNLYLGANSLFEAENIVYNYGSSITGNGVSEAVLKVGECTALNPGQGNIVKYEGKLEIDVPEGKHVDKDIDHWNKRWTKDASVTFGNKVKIESNGCNPGHNLSTNPENNPGEVAKTFAAIYAMEDQWPNFGDYDMNDIVVKLLVTGKGNKIEELTSVDIEAIILAVGGEKKIALGVKIGDETISLCENVYEVVKMKYNTNLNVSLDKQNIELDIPKDQSFFTQQNIDFYIIADGQEIHLKGYKTKSEISVPSGENDIQPSGNDPYVTRDNLVWGICLPGISNWTCPSEGSSITSVYEGFADWVTSSGKSNLNWYSGNK